MVGGVVGLEVVRVGVCALGAGVVVGPVWLVSMWRRHGRVGGVTEGGLCQGVWGAGVEGYGRG